MKGTVTVLLCDDQPDSSGNVYNANGIAFPEGDVPVIIEFAEHDLAAYVGKAKLRMDAGTVYADLQLLSARMIDPARAVLYPLPVLSNVSVCGKEITRATVKYVGLSINRHSDHRIGTLYLQGVR